MAVTLLQSKAGSNNFGGNPWTEAFTSNTAAGSLLGLAVVFEKSTGTATITSIHDTQSNTYTILALESVSSPNAAQIAVAIAYANNTIGGANTVTVTLSAAPNTNIVSLFEFSGVSTVSNPLDQQSANTGVSTNPSAGTVIPTVSGECGIAVCISDDGSGSIAPTAGSGWTRVGNNAGGSWAEASEFIIQAVAASLSGNFVHATGTWVAAMATFLPVLPPIPPTQGVSACISADYQWLGGDDN